MELRERSAPKSPSVLSVCIIMLTMEEAMKQSTMRFAAGEIVKGHVIEVRPKEVMVDIGYKSEGVIAGNWTAKLEYLYADLGDTTCNAVACGVATNVDLTVNVVRAGLNYRF